MSQRRDVQLGRRAVILDRDGTLVIDRGYLAEPEGLELASGTAEGLRLLHGSGYRLIIVTNQSGVGRGLLSMSQLRSINERLERLVWEAGATIERTYFCPHRPEEDCACRKPRPGLVLRAAAELGFHPADAIVVGDQPSDVQLGRSLGAFTIRIDAAHARAADGYEPDICARDLLQAAETILRLRPNVRSGGDAAS